jgi:hypothetical protein
MDGRKGGGEEEEEEEEEEEGECRYLQERL